MTVDYQVLLLTLVCHLKHNNVKRSWCFRWIALNRFCVLLLLFVAWVHETVQESNVYLSSCVYKGSNEYFWSKSPPQPISWKKSRGLNFQISRNINSTSTQVWSSLYFLKWVIPNVMSDKTFRYVWNVFVMCAICLFVLGVSYLVQNLQNSTRSKQEMCVSTNLSALSLTPIYLTDMV